MHQHSKPVGGVGRQQGDDVDAQAVTELLHQPSGVLFGAADGGMVAKAGNAKARGNRWNAGWDRSHRKVSQLL
jgi:hypothetical protein